MISTRNLDELPDIASLRRLTQSLAMLDAILSPEWEYRYYSFNAGWSTDTQMASMRNGEGDHWFALFTEAGAVLHGLAHESPMYHEARPWPGIFEELPLEFDESFRREPAFETSDSSFCIWRRTGDSEWHRGTIEFADGADPDGSAELLALLDGRPESYQAFAQEYYETEIAIEDVVAIYNHTPLSPDLVERLNPDVELEDLADDLEEIGYAQTD